MPRKKHISNKAEPETSKSVHKPAVDEPAVHRPMIIPWTGGPFGGFTKGEAITLVVTGLPDQAIPVFADEAAVYNWAVARLAGAGIFPDDEDGVVFYVSSGTRGVVTRLKDIKISSTSRVPSAKVRLSDGSKRAGWVPIAMIFNPRLEKLVEEWKKRLRLK